MVIGQQETCLIVCSEMCTLKYLPLKQPDENWCNVEL